jgi:hypothetical protein
LWYSRYMSNSYEDDDDSRDYRVDARISREAILERRVNELEATVARLQQDIRAKQLWGAPLEPRERSLASIAGTIGTQNIAVGGGILPQSPHKAD